MAGVPPQPAIHHLPFVSRVGLEPRELPVAHPFEENPHQPESKTDEGEPADRGERGGFENAILRGAGDKEQQHRLAKKYLGQGCPAESPAFAVLGKHARIALVFAFAPPADQQVDCEPQAPDRRHRHQQSGQRPGFGEAQPADHGHDRHAAAPIGIDKTDIVDLHRDHPQHQRKTQQDHDIGKQGFDDHSAFSATRRSACCSRTL